MPTFKHPREQMLFRPLSIKKFLLVPMNITRTSSSESTNFPKHPIKHKTKNNRHDYRESRKMNYPVRNQFKETFIDERIERARRLDLTVSSEGSAVLSTRRFN